MAKVFSGSVSRTCFVLVAAGACAVWAACAPAVSGSPPRTRAVASGAPGPVLSVPAVRDRPGITLNESSITVEINVDARLSACGASCDGSANRPVATIARALELAGVSLQGGKATRIVLQPGTYREGGLVLDASKLGGAAQETLLVIQGASKGAIISGSQVLTAWKPTARDSSVYYHELKKDLGFWGGRFGKNNPPGVLAHRKELLFVNGAPYRQIMLEEWAYTPSKDDWEGEGTHSFKAFNGTSRLSDGTFGITSGEAPAAEAHRIYLRLPPATDISSVTTEFGVHESLLTIVGKKNMVLRNLTFEHAVSGIGMVPFHARNLGAVQIGEEPPFEYAQGHVIIEDCEVRDNNGPGLWLANAEAVDVRRSSIHHNGGNGIDGAYLINSTWDDVAVTHNNWRTAMGGGFGWIDAGVKFWCSKNNVFRGITASHNSGVGFWLDGNNIAAHFYKSDFSNNNRGLDFEISAGPIEVRDSTIAHNRSYGVSVIQSEDVTLVGNLIFDNLPAQLEVHTPDRVFGVPEAFDTFGPKDGQQTARFDRLRLERNAFSSSTPGAKLIVNGRFSVDAEYAARFLKASSLARNVYSHATDTEVFGEAKDTFVDIERWKQLTGESGAIWLDDHQGPSVHSAKAPLAER